ncbi:hypothetical protein ACTXT7_003067 [Hymenolepis weldensis]
MSDASAYVAYTTLKVCSFKDVSDVFNQSCTLASILENPYVLFEFALSEGEEAAMLFILARRARESYLITTGRKDHSLFTT